MNHLYMGSALHLTVFDSTPLYSLPQYSKAANKKALKVLRKINKR